MKKTIALIAMLTILGIFVQAQNPGTSGNGMLDIIERAQAAEAKSLLGAWDVAAIFEDGTKVKYRFNYAPGRNAIDGTVIVTGELDFLPEPVCLTSQGVWERIGSRQFNSTRGSFCVLSGSFVPAGRSKLREEITLNDQGTEMIGRGIVEGFLPDGTRVFFATYTFTGKRVQVEPLN